MHPPILKTRTALFLPTLCLFLPSFRGNLFLPTSCLFLPLVSNIMHYSYLTSEPSMELPHSQRIAVLPQASVAFCTYSVPCVEQHKMDEVTKNRQSSTGQVVSLKEAAFGRQLCIARLPRKHICRCTLLSCLVACVCSLHPQFRSLCVIWRECASLALLHGCHRLCAAHCQTAVLWDAQAL